MTATDHISGVRRSHGKATSLSKATRDTIHSFTGSGRSNLFYLMRSCLGVMFFAAGAGLWLLPGSTDVPEVRIMQMGLTALFLTIGYALFQGTPPAHRPELHIDLMRRCIHLAVRDMTGARVTLAVYQLDELSDMAVIGTRFVASDHNGAEVVNIELHDAQIANALRDFLREMPALYRRPGNLFADTASVA